ncbi:MAG TPA: nucleotidyltransferase family protein [Candidatus Acidoferrales bacterium]|nr:nucleotidyltransferase family protein [Candidatus Acidoferrales bacterium]
MNKIPYAIENLRPELRLLVACAKPQSSASAENNAASLLPQVTDWPYLFAAADRHGVRMLFFRMLHGVNFANVPEQWKEVSNEASRKQIEQNLLFAAELARLLRLLAANGILGIPYKGPVLALQAFGDLGLRDFGDLDILVRHRDIDGVTRLMQAEGYTLLLPAQPPGASEASRVPGQYYFDRAPDFRAVEFHTEKTLRYYPVPLDLDRLRSRLITVPLAGELAATFCAEDALNVLAVHGSKHLWSRLQWVTDLAWLLHATHEFSWPLAMESAGELGAERMTLTGLALASQIFSFELPPQIARRVASGSSVKHAAAQALAEMFSGDAAPAGVAQRAVFRIRSTRGPLSGIRYLLRLIASPTEEDWESARGSRLRQIVLRPLRLIHKYGWGFGRGSEKAAARKRADDAAHRVA